MAQKLIIIVCSIILMGSCKSLRISNEKQGIIGEVRWVEGNMMPAIGDSTMGARLQGIPVQRELYIFKAVNREDVVSSEGAFFKLVHGELVTRLKTDRDGAFKVFLMPGKYSVFTMENDGYFANIFDGENDINPVTVQPNSFTEVKMLVNYRAFY